MPKTKSLLLGHLFTFVTIVIWSVAFVSNKALLTYISPIENMILTALEAGVGSCWLGAVDRDELRKLFRIPKSYRIDSVLALGYPDEAPVVEEATDSIKYWFWNR